jgi:hypothetical protein
MFLVGILMAGDPTLLTLAILVYFDFWARLMSYLAIKFMQAEES